MTYNLITVARKSLEVPKLQEMIRDHSVTLSNARMIAPVLTPENQDLWLSKASTLSKRKLEKEVAREYPERTVQERARFVSDSRLELKLGVSEQLHEKLRKAQDLLSTQSGKSVSLEEALEALADFYIEKKDPLERAKRVEEKLKQPVPGQVSGKKVIKCPRYIPAHIAHRVRLRDLGRCTFISEKGERCSERRWIEIHHLKPLAHGGGTTFENLALVCKGHHQVIHH